MPFSHHDYRLLEEATARAAIAELTVAHSDAYETGDLQAWLNTFTVEGSLTLDGQPPIIGHRALGQYFREHERSGLQLTVNSVVQLDRVTATQRCRVVSLVPGSSSGTVQSVVDYHDALVYERGRWFFLSRAARARL